MATFPTDAHGRLGKVNGARYDAQTNPFGLAIGGHRQVFPPALNDTAVVVGYVGDAAIEIRDFATQTAADRRQTGADRAEVARVAQEAAKFDPALYARLAGGAPFTGPLDLAAPSFIRKKSRDDARFSWNFDVVEVRAGFYWNAEQGVGQEGWKFRIDPDGRLWTPEMGDLRSFIRAGGVQTDLLTAFAGSAQRAGLNVNQRGSAPSAPVNGDVWGLATGLWSFLGGIVRQVYDTTSLPAPTNAEIDAGTNTLRKAFSVADVWRAARAALPAATQAIAEAGTDLIARSWSALAVRQAAIAADRTVLIDGWDASRLNGLSQILIDLPPEFSHYVIKFGGLRLQSGTSLMGLRCGPAGGALNSGANDYQQIVHQYRGGASGPEATQSTNSIFHLFALYNSGAMYGEVALQDGREGFWTAQYQGGGLQSDGNLMTGNRNGRYVQGGGRQGRLQIAFGTALAANGFVQIYGVRS